MADRAVSAKSLALGIGRLFGFRTDSARDAATVGLIRQFESEVNTVADAPVPAWARITVLTLAGMFACAVAILIVTQLDRVVTSEGGKIVSTRQINVLQALDPSIIKSIDVREGDEVQQGQLLGTLDPTFAAADVKQLKRQVASLEALSARAEAQLAGRILVYEDRADPDFAEYAALQKALFKTMLAQYTAQVNSFDAKIKQAEAIVLSMTPRERAVPHVIDGRRRERIARGSGTSVPEVNHLLEARKMMEKMMKQLSGGKMPSLPGMGMPGMPGAPGQTRHPGSKKAKAKRKSKGGARRRR